MSISFCPFCGFTVQEGHNFCKNCGADLSQKGKVTRTRFRGSFWLGALVGIVIMLVVGRVGNVFHGLLIGAFVAGIVSGDPGKGALAGIVVDLTLLALLLISPPSDLMGDYQARGIIEAIVVSVVYTIAYIFLLILVIILIIPCAIIGIIGGAIGEKIYRRE
ncbi:MAG: zinc-ribbon domain-containing protein [Candidatus Hodarchaeota archaeon]